METADNAGFLGEHELARQDLRMIRENTHPYRGTDITEASQAGEQASKQAP